MPEWPGGSRPPRSAGSVISFSHQLSVFSLQRPRSNALLWAVARRIGGVTDVRERHVAFMQDFRRLLVWSRAHAFAIRIRRLTRRFPGVGYSEFKAQLVSAAESIANNIVEGCGAATNKEFARFLDISIKSASELDYRIELAKDYALIARVRMAGPVVRGRPDPQDALRIASNGAVIRQGSPFSSPSRAKLPEEPRVRQLQAR